MLISILHRPIGSQSLLATRNLVLLLIALAAAAVFVNLRFQRGGESRRHLDAGIALLNAHKFRDAASEWRAAIAADPEAPTPYLLLANLYMDSGNPEVALPLLERLNKLAPNMPHACSRLAEAYTLLGKNGKALTAAREAVGRAPNDPLANAILGIQWGNIGETRGSVSALAKAHRLDPADDYIGLSYGQAQLSAIDLSGAETTIRSVLAHNPGYARAHFLLGWDYAHRSQTPANAKIAISAFRKAVQLDPSLNEAWTDLGQILVQTRRYVEAREVLEALWERNRTDAQVAFNLAGVYRALHQPERAAAMMGMFARLQTDQEQYEALRKRFAADPTNADVATQLAEKDLTRGQTDEARVLLHNVLQRRPDDRHAVALAARLQRSMPDDLSGH